jgi:acyl-ACP thioesterase
MKRLRYIANVKDGGKITIWLHKGRWHSKAWFESEPHISPCLEAAMTLMKRRVNAKRKKLCPNAGRIVFKEVRT